MNTNIDVFKEVREHHFNVVGFPKVEVGDPFFHLKIAYEHFVEQGAVGAANKMAEITTMLLVLRTFMDISENADIEFLYNKMKLCMAKADAFDSADDTYRKLRKGLNIPIGFN